MSDAALEGTEIVVTRGDDRILDEVSISVAADAQVLIEGPSGAGKTTLFNVLGLLEPPDGGTLYVGGQSTAVLTERQRAKIRRDTIGFVFQDFQLIPDLSAWENAALPQDHTGDRDEAWLEQLFTALDIDDLRSQYPATLSGGEKQRVAIARALANKPAVILADEPTGQLDPDTADRVLELLFDVREDAGTSLVVISHDRRLMNRFDDRLRLAGGTLTPV